MDRVRAVASRCLAVFRRGTIGQEVDEELSGHLEMAAEEYRRRGMSEAEARLKALQDFGGVTQVRETVRLREGWPWIEHLRRDVGYALRQMRRSPGFAAVVVGTLALGIGAATAMFTLVWSTLLRPLPYPAAQRIVAIHDVRIEGTSTGGLMSMPRFYDLRDRNRSFASLTFFYFDQGTLVTGRQLPVAIQKARTNAAFWRVFGVQPLLGRTYDARDDQPNMPQTLVLSYSGWKKLFGGDPGVVNRQITLDGRAATIVGVMPQGFDVPSGMDMWHCAQFDRADWTKYRGEGTRFINVFARLRRGVTLPMEQADVERIGEQLRRAYPDTDGAWRFRSHDRPGKPVWRAAAGAAGIAGGVGAAAPDCLHQRGEPAAFAGDGAAAGSSAATGAGSVGRTDGDAVPDRERGAGTAGRRGRRGGGVCTGTRRGGEAAGESGRAGRCFDELGRCWDGAGRIDGNGDSLRTGAGA